MQCAGSKSLLSGVCI